MRHLALTCALSAVLLAGCGQSGQDPAVPAAPPTPENAVAETDDAPHPATVTDHAFSPQITAEDFAEHVRILSSDEFEGRGPGSAGERLTTEYLVAQLQRLGARPGNGDSWFQSVPMVEITGSPDTTLKVDFADGQSHEFAYGDDMVVGTRQTVPEASLADSELVFVGYGVNAPEQDWNDYAGLDVTGKTVVVLVNDPDHDAAEGAETPFRGRAMTYYGRWTYKFEEAARQGAAGALIIHETAAASYGWDVVRNSWSGPQYDLPAAEGDRKLDVEGWISGEAAQHIFTANGLDLAEQMAAAKQRGFQAVPLAATVSTTIKNQIRHASSNNVIGIIEGSERPDEYVLFTAHWDHLGRSFSAPGGDGIYNGAIDNATGVAGVLEIGELFASLDTPPERSIVLLLVTLEESGLLGSRYYTENPVLPLAQTAAVVNIDAMSMIGPSNDIVVVGYGNSTLDDYLKAAAQTQQREVVPEPTPENGFYFRSDHFNFAKHGVPAMYAKGGPDHAEQGLEYGQRLAAEYNRDRYHKPADEFDENWDMRGAIQDLEALHHVADAIANSNDWPQWSDTSEFQAAGQALAEQRGD